MSLTLAKPCPISNVDFSAVSLSTELALWYAAYTLPRHEKVVVQQLSLRNVETYLPLYLSARRWAGRRALVQLPLFPGYVFVRIRAGERIRVLDHPGVLRLVTFNGRPSAVPEGEIERLRAALELAKAEPSPYLAPGRRVRVRSGPLAGLEGTILRRKGRMRLVVSVEAIQRSIVFDLDASDLESTIH